MRAHACVIFGSVKAAWWSFFAKNAVSSAFDILFVSNLLVVHVKVNFNLDCKQMCVMAILVPGHYIFSYLSPCNTYALSINSTCLGYIRIWYYLGRYIINN